MFKIYKNKTYFLIQKWRCLILFEIETFFKKLIYNIWNLIINNLFNRFDEFFVFQLFLNIEVHFGAFFVNIFFIHEIGNFYFSFNQSSLSLSILFISIIFINF